MPREITKTLTDDQGTEMSEHTQFTIDPGTTVDFAHPGAPWERGTNEHTNGLLRQYVPQGTEFDRLSTRAITQVQRELNNRPRAGLQWKKPIEAIPHLVA